MIIDIKSFDIMIINIMKMIGKYNLNIDNEW